MATEDGVDVAGKEEEESGRRWRGRVCLSGTGCGERRATRRRWRWVDDDNPGAARWRMRGGGKVEWHPMQRHGEARSSDASDEG